MEHQIIQLIQSITLQMPKGCEKEPQLVSLIWQALSINKSGRNTAGNIQLELDRICEVCKGDEHDFKEEVDERTLARFIKGFRGESGKLNVSHKTLKQITAYLILDESCPLTIEDIHFKTFNNTIAQELTQFIGHEDPDSCDLTPANLEGIYKSEKDLGLDIDTRQLHLESSDDRRHVIVTERKSITRKEAKGQPKFHICLDGFGCTLNTDEVVFYMTNANTGNTQICLSGGVSVEYEKNKPVGAFKLLYTNKPFDFDSELSPQVSKRFCLFTRVKSEILTFPSPKDDKTRADRMMRVLAMRGGSRFSAIDYSKERHSSNMDEQEKLRLGKELFKLVSDEDSSFAGAVELVTQGAPLDYQDPKTGQTPLHWLSTTSREYYEDAIRSSHYEVNFLVRDKRNNLPSAWTANVLCFDDMEETYKAVKKNEEAAGKKIGVNPWVTRDIPFGDHEPS